jgi:hypothetical protein
MHPTDLATAIRKIRAQVLLTYPKADNRNLQQLAF